MRARYSAHVVGDYAFLHRTLLETSTRPYVEEPGEPDTRWTRLEIHSTEPGRTPDIGYVDFSAHFTDGTTGGVHQEKAEFARRDGRWIYVKAVRLGPPPVRAGAPKVGRNDPCPCGSGKKYKHCCL